MTISTRGSATRSHLPDWRQTAIGDKGTYAWPGYQFHGALVGPSRKSAWAGAAAARSPRTCSPTNPNTGSFPLFGWSGVDDAVLWHQCDFTGCTNPHHLYLGTNRSKYDLRRRNVASPISDVRGVGRTRAVAAAVRSVAWPTRNPGKHRRCESETPRRPDHR